jgi:SAM-dependent methyltransferase
MRDPKAENAGPAQSSPLQPGTGQSGKEHGGTGRGSALVTALLEKVLAARAAEAGRTALDIVDVGAGTGGLAVLLARAGHRVTVVDPSPDALAAAGWRAAEAGVAVTEVQGEAGDLVSLVGEEAADLVIFHNVLEYVEDPAEALGAIARVLRPGAAISVLAANAVAAVLQRALAGKYAEARAMLPAGRAAGFASGAAGAGRCTLPELTALLDAAGLRVADVRGIRIFASLLHNSFDQGAGADPVAAEALRELEEAAAAWPPLRDIAARLHVIAYRA